MAVAVGVGVGVPAGSLKGIHFVIGAEVNPATRDHAGIPLARAGHQFVSATACVDHRACVAVVAVQTLVACQRQLPRQSRYWFRQSL